MLQCCFTCHLDEILYWYNCRHMKVVCMCACWQLSLTLLTSICRVNKAVMGAVHKDILPQISHLIRSPLLQGISLIIISTRHICSLQCLALLHTQNATCTGVSCVILFIHFSMPVHPVWTLPARVISLPRFIWMYCLHCIWRIPVSRLLCSSTHGNHHDIPSPHSLLLCFFCL